ncbi:MAG: TRAP transporter small permease [Deltaproteobacteria bacterium]|nr:TRAP transporter small permease [Deltaproteobacteria bacterium]
MLRGFIKKTDRVIEHISNAFTVLSGVLIVLMAFLASYGVIRRYVFNSPEPYSYEMSMMFLLWTFVLALAYLEKLDSHLRVDFFVALLPKKIRSFILNVIGPLAGLVFCAILTWEGWTVAMYSLETEEKSMSIWAVPLFPVKIVVPIGYGLLCVVLLLKIVQGILKTREE